ncbi:NYN domain-containing protein [Corynebacterium sp. CCM 8862]|uniref:NYN domain-containing protein n=2 Tax=Corynebacterium mendelii TaxID=2765362 RepID=A0A939E4H7_9CORY|nr:NYN domain-containing protein [Corynebacterium mendelii]
MSPHGEIDPHAAHDPHSPLDAPGKHTLLLVWDAPNIDMGLGSILGGKPDSANRPRFDAVGLWLLRQAQVAGARAGHSVAPEATVFTNVARGSEDSMRSWVEALRNVGFAVFAKPKVSEDSDVDPDMLAHIKARHDAGVLHSVVVASADGQNFQSTLEELVAEGIPATVIGFREHASWAVTSEPIEFVDLEDIDGVFRYPLPRLKLENLPENGGWLPPFRPLSCLASNQR